MAEELQRLIGLDSSVLIEHFRKTKKENSFFFQLSRQKWEGFVVSVVVRHEIYKGAAKEQILLWNNLFEDFIIAPYTLAIDSTSLLIYKQLKKSRRSIQFQDLVIAATSLHYNYSLATINEKHFDNIEGLHLITPSSFQP